MNIPGIDESGSDRIELDGPGRGLRVIREKQHMDISKVASRLNLGVAQLQALEDDDYDRLPDPVFVRGYLRNYARLLGVPEEPVLESYNTVRPERIESTRLIGHPPSADDDMYRSRGGIRLTTWIIVMLLVAVVALWWRVDLYEAGRKIVGKLGSLSSVVAVTSSDDVEQLQTLLPPISVAEDQDQSELDDAVVVQIDRGRKVESGLPLEQDRVETKPETEQLVVVEVKPVAFLEQPVKSDLADTIVFKFNGPSWINVIDARGAVQIRGRLAAGDRRELDGLAPFHVVLGNAPVVSLMVDGEPFNLERYTKQRVARFTFNP